MRDSDFKYLYHLIELNQISTFLEVSKKYFGDSIFKDELTLLVSKKERLEKGIRVGLLSPEEWSSEEATLSRECLLFCNKIEKSHVFLGRSQGLVRFWRYGLGSFMIVLLIWTIWYFSVIPFRSVFILQDSIEHRALTTIDSGFLELEIGGNFRKEPIRGGRIVFENMPKSFKGSSSKVNLFCKGYNLSPLNTPLLLKNGTIYIDVEKIKYKHRVFGRVQSNGTLIGDAEVILGEKHAFTDAAGFFEIFLPETSDPLKNYRLLVKKSGYELWDANILSEDEIDVVLNLSKPY